MAVGALVSGSGMAHLGGFERSKISVSSVTLRGRWNVIDWLAEGRRSVATATGSDRCRRMNIGCSCPRSRRAMTGIALAGCQHVRSRLGLRVDQKIVSIVASRALAGCACMAHHSRCKCRVILVA